MLVKIKYGMILVLIIIILTYWNAVQNVQAGEGTPLSEMIVATYDVDKLKVSPGTETLFVVQSNGEKNNATGILFAYTRTIGPGGTSAWKDEMIGIPVKLGRGGVGKTKEGDAKTPLGIFDVNTPFGINSAKEGFPANYLQVNENLYWNSDGNSATYNKLVDRSKNKDFDASKSEHLIDVAPDYCYALNIGYNSEGKKGAGSAIFLHCLGKDKDNTSGCIAVKEDSMIQLMRLYKEGKTQILIENAGSFSKWY